MVFWHMGGNKLWSSVAPRCKLFPSQRKHTGEAGIGLGPRSVSERQKIPRWDRNLSLRSQSQIQVLPSSFSDWQGQLRLSQLAVGRGDSPVSPYGSGCHHFRWPSPKWPLQWSWPKAVSLCFWQSGLSAFPLSILRDLDWCWQGKGGEQHSLCWESVCAGAVRPHLVSKGS